jgi:hypothetical protein
VKQKEQEQNQNIRDEWCEHEIMNAYKEAAECDEFIFGDYDYCKEWLGANN